jgi:hypothetical protein
LSAFRLALNGGINAVSQQSLGIVALGAGICKRDEGILADREQLLLGVKAIGLAPELRSGFGDKHEEAATVGSLIVFFASFQMPKVAVVLDRHGFDSTQKSQYHHPDKLP